MIHSATMLICLHECLFETGQRNGSISELYLLSMLAKDRRIPWTVSKSRMILEKMSETIGRNRTGFECKFQLEHFGSSYSSVILELRRIWSKSG